MSKKDPWYVQCRFETEPTEKGKKVDTAWIPEKFAKVGKRIYIGDKRPSPEDTEIWTVTAVFDRKPSSWVIERRMDYKHQRSVSDI